MAMGENILRLLAEECGTTLRMAKNDSPLPPPT